MRIILAILLVFSTTLIFAQPKIEFEKTTHDYGDVEEDGGMAETNFTFINTGDQPLILNNVRASCGCTTPSWTREPVAPMGTGSIKVAYNPKNRPGNFSKSISVYTNSTPSVTVLKIQGKVLPREKTMEEKFPRVMGPIRWKTNYISLGSVLNTQKITKQLEYINPSDSPVKLGVHRSPAHINIRFVPETLEPGMEGKMIVEFDATGVTRYGFTSDRVYLLMNGESENTYSVGVSGTINEDFSSLSKEELANAPVATFDSQKYDFGTIVQGESASKIFKLTNEGKSDLLIRNVRTSCGCTAVKHATMVKPGQTIDLEVTFNSRGKRNRQNKSVTVITNDPKNPTTVLRMMGVVNVPTTN